MQPTTRHEDAQFLDLLLSWLSGEFRRDDEQKLSQLAASDDFRREALDGFSEIPEADHTTHLVNLQARLRARQQPLSVKFFNLPRMMAAAAVLILVFAAVVFFQKEDKPAAVTLENTTSPEPPSIAHDLRDWNKDNFRQPPEPAHKSPLPAKPKSGENPPMAYVETAPSEKQPTEQQIEQTEAASGAAEKTDSGISSYTLAKENTPPQPAPPSVVADRAKKMPESASRTALPAAPIRHDTDKMPNMANARRPDDFPAQPEPLLGWDAFREHLRQNALLTAEARNNNVSGTVRLQFVVGADGEPLNFLILKSLGYGCDEEAVRLVKDFEWLPGKNNLVTVDVKFSR